MPTIDPQEPNTAVEVYFQVGKDNVLDRVLVDVLIQMMYEPLYDELRTKEQFGYHVSCGSRWTFEIIGLCFDGWYISNYDCSTASTHDDEFEEKEDGDWIISLVDMVRRNESLMGAIERRWMKYYAAESGVLFTVVGTFATIVVVG